MLQDSATPLQKSVAPPQQDSTSRPPSGIGEEGGTDDTSDGVNGKAMSLLQL